MRDGYRQAFGAPKEARAQAEQGRQLALNQLVTAARAFTQDEIETIASADPDLAGRVAFLQQLAEKL